MPARKEMLRIEGRDVPISNPEKIFFPQRGYTKLDVVRYFLAVSEGALRGAGDLLAQPRVPAQPGDSTTRGYALPQWLSRTGFSL